MALGKLGFINRNLLVLFACQTVFVSGSVLLVTVGGIVGYELASAQQFATLPVALMVVGTALATIPAAFVMQRVGRRWGFMLATVIAASGAALATLALDERSFVLFCCATALVGSSLGFSQQFRFAAAESVSLDKVSHAVSFILLGSIAGAFLGPEIVALSASRNAEAPYGFAFTVMIGLYGVACAVLVMLQVSSPEHDADIEQHAEPRPFLQLIRHPAFATAVLAGVVGQGVMTYVMTATPISMKVMDGFSLQVTADVIRAHVIAMYLPSLITPWLVNTLGLPRMMTLGVFALGATLVIGLAGHQYMHYWFAMVLLGVGWNFLFVGGTTQLVQSYRSDERFKAQAFNDFSVFGASAMASLLAGTMLHVLGWNMLLISALPALLMMLAAIAWSVVARRAASAESS